MSSSPRSLLGVGAAIVLVVVVLVPDAAVGDVDGDGNLDLVFANAGQNRVCMGDGSGGFTCRDVSANSLESDGVAIGDLDGDGHVDAVFENHGPNQVCMGDGSGGFVCHDLGAEDEFIGIVALGDFDSDRRLDVVGSGRWELHRLCLGDGVGGFACRDFGADSNSVYGARDIAVGNLNSDGDLDVVFANGMGPNRSCLGDGSGGFTCRDVSANRSQSNGVELGDLNGDGNLDAVFAQGAGLNRACLGDGSGGFACRDIPSRPNGSKAIALGDLDGDGILDLVSRSYLEFGLPSLVCLGDGSGGFACQDLNRGDEYIDNGAGVHIGDVDGDGDLDALFPTGADRPNRICLGDGSGRFACRDLDADSTGCMAVAIVPSHRGSYADDDRSVFEVDVEWMAAEGITRGCNPPVSDRFCPDSVVTRGQMAAFLVRALGLTDRVDDPFVDDDGSIFEPDIERLAAAGITKGCNPPANDQFCPASKVTRGQMAAFLVRALGYADDGGGNLFVDDDASIFEADIDRLGTAGVTKGCNPPANDRFCPNSVVTRGQMAAFLHRALG